jgi:hypothetical protein
MYVERGTLNFKREKREMGILTKREERERHTHLYKQYDLNDWLGLYRERVCQ